MKSQFLFNQALPDIGYASLNRFMFLSVNRCGTHNVEAQMEIMGFKMRNIKYIRLVLCNLDKSRSNRRWFAIKKLASLCLGNKQVLIIEHLVHKTNK